MATESEHKQQARHNQTFLGTIDANHFPDWVATVAFYEAVHLIEMFFAHKVLYPGGSHTKRNNVLKRSYPAIWKDYRPLYAFSRLARYWCMKVTPENADYIRKRLRRVEEAINRLTA